MCRTAVKLSAVYGILFLVDEITTAEHVFSSATPSAMLTTGNTGDWTQVGRQNLDHADNHGNDKPREVKDVGSRAIPSMGFVSSDINSIRFTNQVPEMSSSALLWACVTWGMC